MKTAMCTGIGSQGHSGRGEVNTSQTSTEEINKDWNYISKPPTCLDGRTDRHDAANSHIVALHMYGTCTVLV